MPSHRGQKRRRKDLSPASDRSRRTENDASDAQSASGDRSSSPDVVEVEAPAASKQLTFEEKYRTDTRSAPDVLGKYSHKPFVILINQRHTCSRPNEDVEFCLLYPFQVSP